MSFNPEFSGKELPSLAQGQKSLWLSPSAASDEPFGQTQQNKGRALPAKTCGHFELECPSPYDYQQSVQSAFISARDACLELARKFLSPGTETRACWFDRKTIVSAGPGELSREIRALAEAGINTIYFECDNGGYSLYDSKLLRKNPDLAKWEKWDPLREAIDAAHTNGIKIEAWAKVFSVCNRALDNQLRKNHPGESFPPDGPILSKHQSTTLDPNGDWALRQVDGKLQEGTNDIFLDPANPEAREFAESFMLELATHYPDLDGIQYDYIRYPFHNEQLGLNDNNWKSFQKEYPRYKDENKPAYPAQLNAQILNDWNLWKAGRIDSFVKDTSERLLKQNPKLDLAAAVYPCDLNESVRQHWDKWVKNGWIKTLNPMTYVPHDPNSKDAEFGPEFARKLQAEIGSIMSATNGKTNVLPGIEVGRVNPDGMIKEVEIIKQMGLPGETLFASSVLSDKRLEEFEMIDAKNDFTGFSRLLHICWSGGDAGSAKQHRNFLLAADTAGSALQNLSASASVNELKPVLEQIHSLQYNIILWLSQNHSEKSVWTDEFMKLLDQSINKLSAAANPKHFIAWDAKQAS